MKESPHKKLSKIVTASLFYKHILVEALNIAWEQNCVLYIGRNKARDVG